MKKVLVKFFALTILGLGLVFTSCGDPCEGVICNNGGTCTDGVCSCVEPWSGATCDTNTDLCHDVACGANGTCDATTGGCDCNAGWEGDSCSVQTSLNWEGSFTTDENCDSTGTASYTVSITPSTTQDDKINFVNLYGMVDAYGVSTPVYGTVSGMSVTIPSQTVTDGTDTWTFSGSGTMAAPMISMTLTVDKSGIDVQSCDFTMTKL